MQQFVEALSDFIVRPCARPCFATIKLMFGHWFVLLDRMQRGFQIKGSDFACIQQFANVNPGPSQVL